MSRWSATVSRLNGRSTSHVCAVSLRRSNASWSVVAFRAESGTTPRKPGHSYPDRNGSEQGGPHPWRQRPCSEHGCPKRGERDRRDGAREEEEIRPGGRSQPARVVTAP